MVEKQFRRTTMASERDILNLQCCQEKQWRENLNHRENKPVTVEFINGMAMKRETKELWHELVVDESLHFDINECHASLYQEVTSSWLVEMKANQFSIIKTIRSTVVFSLVFVF